jgi:hypothetical protein
LFLEPECAAIHSPDWAVLDPAERLLRDDDCFRNRTVRAIGCQGESDETMRCAILRENVQHRPAPTRAGQKRALAILLVLYSLVVLAFGIFGKSWASDDHGIFKNWAILDQTLFHLPQINFFVHHIWSWVDYPATSATTPGAHLLVAMVARLAGLNYVAGGSWLQIVIPWLMGLAILASLWWSLFLLAGDPWRAALYCLPIASSSYFLLPSLYLVTDNQGYLGYVLVLLGYLHYPTESAALGIIAALMVFTRQVYFPVVAAYPIAFFGQIVPRVLGLKVILKLVLAILPPIVVVAVYAIEWRGLVPPNFAHHRTHILDGNALVELFALLGILSIPYALLIYPSLSVLGYRRIAGTMLVCGALALLFWALVASTASAELGRRGSVVWDIAHLSPTLGEHALLVLPLLVLGAWAIGLMINLAGVRRYLPIELIMLLLYAAALSAQDAGFQRYSEVPILITLSTTAARLEAPRRWNALAFSIIFAVYLAVAAMRIAGVVGNCFDRAGNTGPCSRLTISESYPATVSRYVMLNIRAIQISSGPWQGKICVRPQPHQR